MIPEFFQRIFKLDYEYVSVLEQVRAQRLLYIVGTFMIIAGAWLVVFTLPLILGGTAEPYDLIAPPFVFVITILLYRLIQRGRVTWASRTFVFLIFMLTVPTQIDRAYSPHLIQVMIPIILAGVLLSQRAMMTITVLVVLVFVRDMLFGSVRAELSETVAISLTIVLCGMFLGMFTSSLEKITQTASNLIVQARRLREYNTNDEASSAQRDMIIRAINLLRSNLGFSYIRVVLLDDKLQPLQTLYSSIGVEQVAESSTFSYTNNSAFQQAIRNKTATIVTQQDPGNLSAHLLPSSGAGVILPAISFDHILALVDIQSENTEIINPETVAILDLFIDQLASNLIYQRTVTALRDDIGEQQLIINQQRQQLLNIQHMQSEGIVADWENYLKQRGLDTIGYDIDNRRQISDLNMGNIPEHLRPAFEDGEVMVQEQDNQQIVTIPIRFRDTILGVISFTVPKELPMTERKLEFVRSVTERLALALDNKRLFEQTQTQVERESTANEIGSILLSSTDVQTVLQTAANRFNEALGAVATQIYLQPDILLPIENQQLEDTV